MEYNKDKVDEMVLALLYLTMFEEKPGWRASKGHDWDALDRLAHPFAFFDVMGLDTLFARVGMFLLCASASVISLRQSLATMSHYCPGVPERRALALLRSLKSRKR